jgi:hypothetical protein
MTVTSQERIQQARLFWGAELLKDATQFTALVTKLVEAEDRAEIAEAKLAAVPTSALVDYYYNSWPQNEDALRAAKILDPWMETTRV